MKTNYFNTEAEAVKFALNTEPGKQVTALTPSDEGKKITGTDQKGNVIFYSQYINPVMGWQNSFIIKN